MLVHSCVIMLIDVSHSFFSTASDNCLWHYKFLSLLWWVCTNRAVVRF